LRIGLGSLGACLFGLLALGWLPGTARNRPLLGLGLLAVPDAGLRVAPEPGNSDAFEPVPQAVHVQGQEGATYSTRPHQDWCQIEADHPQQYLIGRITESRRNFEIEIRMHMEGPVVDLGLSYAPIEEQLVERHSLFWMLHLARLPFDPDEPTRINWKVRFDRYTLTNPPIVPLSDVVRRGLLMVSGEEAPAQGQFPMRTGAPNLPLILRIEQGRLVQMRFDQGVVPIQMPADAPDFQGDLRILVAGAEEAPDPEGRPRPRGLVKIWKPKFSYVD